MRVKCDERASRLELTAISYFLNRERAREATYTVLQKNEKKKKKKKSKAEGG